MPPAGDDNPGGGSARGPPAFFREWKRMHREATRDGGDDDHAYDEGAAMFAHQVAIKVKIENITRKLERAERRKDADQVEKFARKSAKFQEKLEAMTGSQRAVQWYDGDAEASYELRGVELLTSGGWATRCRSCGRRTARSR